MWAFQKQLYKSLEKDAALHDTKCVPGKTNNPLFSFLNLEWSQQRTVSGTLVFMHILSYSVLYTDPFFIP